MFSITAFQSQLENPASTSTTLVFAVSTSLAFPPSHCGIWGTCQLCCAPFSKAHKGRAAFEAVSEMDPEAEQALTLYLEWPQWVPCMGRGWFLVWAPAQGLSELSRAQALPQLSVCCITVTAWVFPFHGSTPLRPFFTLNWMTLRKCPEVPSHAAALPMAGETFINFSHGC